MSFCPSPFSETASVFSTFLFSAEGDAESFGSIFRFFGGRSPSAFELDSRLRFGGGGTAGEATEPTVGGGIGEGDGIVGDMLELSETGIAGIGGRVAGMVGTAAGEATAGLCWSRKGAKGEEGSSYHEIKTLGRNNAYHVRR